MKALGLTLRRLPLGCRRTSRRRRRPLGLALRSLSLAHRRRMRSHLGSLSLRTLSGGKLVLVLELREETSSPGHPRSLLNVRAHAVATDATPGARYAAIHRKLKSLDQWNSIIGRGRGTTVVGPMTIP